MMRILALAVACLAMLTGLTGWSAVGSGIPGGVAGAGATDGSYKYHLRRQKDRVEQEFKTGKIDQKQYEIRKDQIIRDTLLQ